MKGIICLWSGAIVDIPAGWHLCDGTAGTPDLRNRFVVGAGDTYNPDDTGGALTHDHDFTGNGHTHIIPYGTDIADGTGKNYLTGQTPAVGTTNVNNHLPPYFALCFIMKL